MLIPEIDGGGAFPASSSSASSSSSSTGINWGFAIGLILFVIALIGVYLYFYIKNTLDNGGTILQAFVGKKLGALCDGNKMCASNYCNDFKLCSV